MSIYQSDWAPRGVRKTWERIGLTNGSAEHLIGEWCKGKIVDACGWFSGDGSLRVMVADTDKGKRVTYRRQPSGEWVLKIEPRPGSTAGAA